MIMSFKSFLGVLRAFFVNRWIEPSRILGGKKNETTEVTKATQSSR
jgi:hypothetical protein